RRTGGPHVVACLNQTGRGSCYRQRVGIKTWVCKLRWIPNVISLAFICAEEKDSVLFNRSAECCSKLLQADLLLLIARQKRIARVGFVPAAEVIACSMPAVRAGL